MLAATESKSTKMLEEGAKIDDFVDSHAESGDNDETGIDGVLHLCFLKRLLEAHIAIVFDSAAYFEPWSGRAPAASMDWRRKRGTPSGVSHSRLQAFNNYGSQYPRIRPAYKVISRIRTATGSRISPEKDSVALSIPPEFFTI